MISDLQLRIVPRTNAAGNPFTEIFYDYLDCGEPRKALTRVWYVLDDTPHARAAEREAFLRRMAST